MRQPKWTGAGARWQGPRILTRAGPHEQRSLLPVRHRTARAHRQQEISPVEVVGAVLARAEALQPELNCFITICGDKAMAGRARPNARLMAGEPLGLLHGIPVHRQGHRQHQGRANHFRRGSLQGQCADRGCGRGRKAARARRDPDRQDHDAGIRQQVPDGLAVVRPHPQRLERRSAPAAAPAAARRWRWRAASRPLAIATDGGGSTRIPAACNGVVGLKQSNGVIPHSQALDAFGNQTYVTPMTRTVADTALMMQAMAGEDACDPWSIGVPVPDFIGTRRAARRSARAKDPVLRVAARPPGVRRCRGRLQGEPRPAGRARRRARGILRRGV